MHAKTCRLLLSVKMGAESALIWRRSKAATTLWPATFNIIFDFTLTKWLGYAAGHWHEWPIVWLRVWCECGHLTRFKLDLEFSCVSVTQLECISVFDTPGNLVWLNFQHWQIYNKFIDLYPFSHSPSAYRLGTCVHFVCFTAISWRPLKLTLVWGDTACGSIYTSFHKLTKGVIISDFIEQNG